MNLAALLRRAGQAYGDMPAVALGPRTVLDYAGLARRSAVLAGGLRDRLGLAPGARVALVMTNHPAYVEILYACWWAGLAAVPVNAKLHEKEVRYILESSGAETVFATPKLADALGRVAEGLPASSRVIDVDSADYEKLLTGEPAPMAEVAPDDLAWLFFTSGTTGRPKGAMLTHRVLQAMTLSYFADVDSIRPGEAILHAAPMSHGSGLYIAPHVAGAATQIIPESGGFEPEEIFDLLPGYPGTAMFAAPTMVKRLMEHPAAASADTRNLKTVVYGGGPMYVADLKRAIDTFGQVFVQIYGQGESPMTITCLPRWDHQNTAHPRYEARLASVGRPHAVVEVMIADEDDRPLPPGETGEVLVRGDSVMPGYWQAPEATAETLRGGWLHTGDVGALDADGYLTLMDRSKDVIISGGTNIYPREVEEVLLRHPGVAEVSVVGKPHPEWGEEVAAFVVARPDAAPAAEAQALDELCLGEIARFKRPRHWYFVDALPKNNYGKVLKTELRKRLQAEGEGAA
ncbi:AMP-binding protein [Ferruginivarius sediminum]|uniref:3-methylmercaptopropionyl-CoA ligase n=1 Tax=Ferruginivarius sediminum TaxID=2661937 RepID=A0A369T8M3_9PROT|nr:AMP-binding protein [Ferruginivarius sediminum]RDD60705.1 long-chain fatty acid--CoA ligase [Ferruginivarius sediminum]